MVYDYAPTPSGIHVAVEEALDRAQMIAPASGAACTGLEPDAPA